MQRWHGLGQVPEDWDRCVVTIGVFDGVHRGHQAIIGKAVEKARELGVPSVVLTFVPHPSEVVRPGSHPPIISSLVRRAELVEALGVDVFLPVRFTPELAQLPASAFVKDVLVDKLHVAGVVVGENFRFGNRAVGNVALLRQVGATAGFTAEGISLLSDGRTPISSSYVRSRIAEGDVDAAARALGRPHRIDGIVERGDQRGRELGFPTANLRTEQWTAVPADGVYAGRVLRLDEWGRTLQMLGTAAISVGTNPTFDVRQRRVEAYVLDFDGDLYGDGIGIEFVWRLRGMEKFDGIEPLVKQMNLDVERTREIMG